MKYAPHAVYLMKNDWSESNYKVGFSNNPSRRSTEMEENYGVNPSIISTCWFPSEYDARAAELIWHRRFASYRSDDHGGREWFSLPSAHVDEFKEWCSHSPDHQELLDDLFKGGLTFHQVKILTDKLFKLIPKPQGTPRVDVWVSPHYQTQNEHHLPKEREVSPVLRGQCCTYLHSQ